MKKISITLTFLFCLFSFNACSDDDDNKEHYLDNKLIEGTWYDASPPDSLIYTFRDGKFYDEFYAKISGSDTLKYEGTTDRGNYRLTDTLIILIDNSPRHEYIYRLANNNDSLYIRNPVDMCVYWKGYKRAK